MIERQSNTRSQQEDQHDLAFCILWSPLPPITWFLPFIGHMGIADSNGVASDFQGSFYVGERGRMAFGEPTRALRMNIDTLPGEFKIFKKYYFTQAMLVRLLRLAMHIGILMF
jgi:Protein of unknown function (DUF778).